MNNVGDQHMKTDDIIKLWLCCAFNGERIKFRSTTVKSVCSMERSEASEKNIKDLSR